MKLLAEAVEPRFSSAKIQEYQKKSWGVLREIRGQITEGMTEAEGYQVALSIFSGFGVTTHWHRPYLRFGGGTVFTSSTPLQQSYRLQSGDPVYIDVGPVWVDSESGLSYEGDVGESFVLGSNPEAENAAQTAKNLFFDAQKAWKRQSLTGQEIYAWLKDQATDLGYNLNPNITGHRIGDFPHQQYSKERLARLPFCPTTGLWVLEIHIIESKSRFGAFYEDIL